jgi:hypothetical protein
MSSCTIVTTSSTGIESDNLCIHAVNKTLWVSKHMISRRTKKHTDTNTYLIPKFATQLGSTR